MTCLKHLIAAVPLLLAAHAAHEAAAHDAEVVSMPIGAGAEIDAVDFQGMTPLRRAAESGADPRMVDLLVAAGADKGIRDLAGRLPMDHALGNDTLPGVVKLRRPADGELR